MSLLTLAFLAPPLPQVQVGGPIQGPMDLCWRGISESAWGAPALLNLVLHCYLVFSENKDQAFVSHFLSRCTERNLLKLGSQRSKQEGR